MEHVVIFAKQILKNIHLDRLERNFQVDTSIKPLMELDYELIFIETLIGYELAGRFISDKVLPLKA